VREVWSWGGPNADHAVDVTVTYPRKLAALRAHASQTSHMPDLDGLIRERLTRGAATAGLPEGSLAEMFTVVRTG
jgi:LmbE family N-acetylglucosaminyl deacetylase